MTKTSSIHDTDTRPDGLVLTHQVEEWQTTSVTPLTGWVNLKKTPAGGFMTEPCPAILTQKSTELTDYYHLDPCASRFDALKIDTVKHKRICRTIFGEISLGSGEIHPAGWDEEEWTPRYITTLPAGDAAAYIASRAGEAEAETETADDVSDTASTDSAQSVW